MRAAYTLIEITIATLILGIVMAIALQVTVASRTHEASASAQDELAEDVLRIGSALSDDLALSGWHIPDGTTSLAAESALEPGIGMLTDSLAADRERRYYPYIIGEGQGTPPGGGSPLPRDNPTWFAHARLAGSLLPDSAAVVAAIGTGGATVSEQVFGPTAPASARAWYGDYSAPSQSIVLLRGFTFDGGSALEHTDPQREAKYEAYLRAPGLPQLAFGGTSTSDSSQWTTGGNHAALRILHASGVYEQSGAWIDRGAAGTPYGVHLESGYIVTGPDGSLKVNPQWETTEPPGHARPADEDVWREYLYTVVRSPVAGRFGRLVRAHRHVVSGPVPPIGTGPGDRVSADSRVLPNGDLVVFVIDRVLSDNVARIIFDTFRTDRVGDDDPGRLDVNQVRVRLFMARPDLGTPGARPITRVITQVFTMRAKNTNEQRNEDATLLGGLSAAESAELLDPLTTATRRDALADKVRAARVGFPR